MFARYCPAVRNTLFRSLQIRRQQFLWDRQIGLRRCGKFTVDIVTVFVLLCEVLTVSQRRLLCVRVQTQRICCTSCVRPSSVSSEPERWSRTTRKSVRTFRTGFVTLILMIQPRSKPLTRGRYYMADDSTERHVTFQPTEYSMWHCATNSVWNPFTVKMQLGFWPTV